MSSTPSFSRGGHDIRVTVLLDADEFMSLQSMTDEDGLSDSAFMRRLLKLESRKRAMGRLSERQSQEESAEPAHVLNTKVGVV